MSNSRSSLIDITKVKFKLVSMSLGKFVQNNCIIMQLKLRYKSASPLNESLVHRKIVGELQKLGNVLYSSSNAASWQQTLKRNPPKIDMVISSSALGILSAVLLNLRGFSIPNSVPIPKRPLLQDSFTSLHESACLKELYSDVSAKWAHTDHRSKSRAWELSPFIISRSWIFNSTPAARVPTSRDDFMDLDFSDVSTYQGYHSREFTGSRFFDFSRWQPGLTTSSVNNTDKSAEFYDYVESQFDNSRHVYLEPVLYPDYDSLPTQLQNWLDRIGEEEATELTPEEKRKLEFMLHGFKGFEI